MRELGTCAFSALLFVAAACGGDDSTTSDGGTDTGTATDSSSDATPDAPLDSGADTAVDAGPDSSMDAAMDATPDAAPDAVADAAPDAVADTRPDTVGMCPDCIAAGLDWGDVGGFRASVRRSTLSVCRDYRLTETRFSDPGSSVSCMNELPCAATDAITVADLEAALAHPDVVAAFAAAPITYGRDLRPVDGSAFEVSQSGRTFLVGTPCGGRPSCTPIPTGVEALVTLLRAIDTERLAEPDCTTVFP